MPAGLLNPTPPSQAAVARCQARSNVWTSSSVNPLKRTAISNACSQVSNASSKVPRTLAPQGTGTSGATQLGQMKLSGSSNPVGSVLPPVLNPSNVPSPSMVGNPQRVPVSVAPTQLSTTSQPVATHNAVTKNSNLTAKSFRRGDIINLPYHEPNTNISLTPGNRHLAPTCAGYVFSKRRYAVVLWVTLYHVFCVPIYSFDGYGIGGKKDHQKREYVCLKSKGDKNFYNAGVYEPVESDWGNFHPASAIHVTAGFNVECRCDIAFSGRLTKEGYDLLYNHWLNMSQAAKLKS